jgi:hypothetical protein
MSEPRISDERVNQVCMFMENQKGDWSEDHDHVWFDLRDCRARCAELERTRENEDVAIMRRSALFNKLEAKLAERDGQVAALWEALVAVHAHDKGQNAMLRDALEGLLKWRVLHNPVGERDAAAYAESVLAALAAPAPEDHGRSSSPSNEGQS